MDFGLEEMQLAARDAVAQTLAPWAGQGRPESWRDVWQRLIGSGMVELCATSSTPSLETAEALIGLGRHALAAPLHGIAALAPVLSGHGTAAARARWSDALADGATIVSVATGEVSGYSPETTGLTLDRGSNGWMLSGTAIAVPLAEEATRLLLWARQPSGSAAVVLVDPHGTGVELRPQVDTSGEHEWTVRFDGAPVPDADLVSEPGDVAALDLMRHSLLLGLAAEQLGLAEAAIEMTARYVTEREQFGRPIGTFQAVSNRLADAYIDLTAMRWTLYGALDALRSGEAAEAPVAIAKFWASEGGARIMATAVHLHGGVGVDTTYPLHRYYLRSRRIDMSLGSSGAQLAQLWKAIA